MGQGWIKLHREIRDCDLIWDDKPFSRGQAWIDLLLMANHKEKQIMVNANCITVERGQILTSTRKLSEQWGWSRKKTTKFLNELKIAQMVTIKSTTKYTTLKLINYGVYQDMGTTEEPQKSHRGATEEPQRNTNKNDKEYIKNDKELIPPISPTGEKEGEKQKRFCPPTVEEVIAYCLERQNGINGNEFHDFYTSKGWKVGKSPMKDWRAAVRTWERKRGFTQVPNEADCNTHVPNEAGVFNPRTGKTRVGQ